MKKGLLLLALVLLSAVRSWCDTAIPETEEYAYKEMASREGDTLRAEPLTVTTSRMSKMETIYRIQTDIRLCEGDLITGITFRGYNPGEEQTRHFTVWLKNDNSMGLPYEFSSTDDMTKVFDGDCTIMNGGTIDKPENILYIVFQTPLSYINGYNIRMVVMSQCEAPGDPILFLQSGGVTAKSVYATSGQDGGFEEPISSDVMPFAVFTIATPVRYVSGTVTDEDAKGVAGATIRLRGMEWGGLTYEGITDSEGKYRIRIEEGNKTYMPSASAPGHTSFSQVSGFSVKDNPTKDFTLYGSVTYPAKQQSTIILPVAPDATVGKYYRLSYRDGKKFFFVREPSPQANVPYVLFADRDYRVDLADMDLTIVPGRTDIDSLSLVGTYSNSIDAYADYINYDLETNSTTGRAMHAHLYGHYKLLLEEDFELVFVEENEPIPVAEIGRPMLVGGKTWWYTYHHFEDLDTEDVKETAQWKVGYTLQGDTVINGRQYMKMYRRDQNGSRYYGALREDEKGRVWQYDAEHNNDMGDNGRFYDGDDAMLCDYTAMSYSGEDVMPTTDVVNINGVRLHRYNWHGHIGVEGVGFAGKGLVYYLQEPVVPCICDYESFDYMIGSDGFMFTNADFTAPKYIELTQEEQQRVAQNNDFAFRLFRQARTEESQVLSPLSITYALGLANNGAQGQTQREISQVLGFNNVDAQNEFCLKMQNEFGTAGLYDPTTKAHTANTIFVNSGMGWQLQDDFKRKASEYYYAYPENRDFADGQTRNVINKWAADHTEQMIKEVLSEDEFDPFAVSYQLNAIYFKGAWTSPFNADNTREEPFAGGNSVPMMHQVANVMYAENDYCQTVVLPYGNGTYQMRMILPYDGWSLDHVATFLNASNWQIPTYSCEVDLKLPRFETDTSIDLKQVMSALGMPTAFDPDEADFTKLCESNDGAGNIYIDKMKQVAKIKVNEEGTEAAAVTTIGYIITSVPEHVDFHATRPFLYIISEQSTGGILFIGQYMGDATVGIDDAPRLNDKGKMINDKYRGVYDLQGRQVETSNFKRQTSKLPKGLVIRNGRKHLVK